MGRKGAAPVGGTTGHGRIFGNGGNDGAVVRAAQ